MKLFGSAKATVDEAAGAGANAASGNRRNANQPDAFDLAAASANRKRTLRSAAAVHSVNRQNTDEMARRVAEFELESSNSTTGAAHIKKLGDAGSRQNSFPLGMTFPIERTESPKPIEGAAGQSEPVFSVPIFRMEAETASKSILQRMVSLRRRGERQLQAHDIASMSDKDRYKVRQRQKALLADPTQSQATQVSALMSLYQLGMHRYGSPEKATHYALMKGMAAFVHYPAAADGESPHPAAKSLEDAMLNLCASGNDVIFDSKTLRQQSLYEMWDKEHQLKAADFSVVESLPKSGQAVHDALEQIVVDLNRNIHPANRRVVTKSDVEERYILKQAAKRAPAPLVEDDLPVLMKQRKSLWLVADQVNISPPELEELLTKAQKVNQQILAKTKF